MFTPNSNLTDLRRFCLRYPQSLGLPNPVGVSIKGSKFILDPALDKQTDHRFTWYRALKMAAWLNQDGYCICGEKLDQAELHHALISKKDIQGDKRLRRLINHSYNVILAHPKCHTHLVREKCCQYLVKLYGDDVLVWYEGFPLKSKLSLRRTDEFSYRRNA